MAPKPSGGGADGKAHTTSMVPYNHTHSSNSGHTFKTKRRRFAIVNMVIRQVLGYREGQGPSFRFVRTLT